MAVKKCIVPELGEVKLYKRRDARHVRISIKHDGSVNVTLPYWTPYKFGIEFVKSKSDWIKNKRVIPAILNNGMRLGKAHTLYFIQSSTSNRISTRVTSTEIKIMLPPGFSQTDDASQTAARQACIRALHKEAETLLPQRVKAIAVQNDFAYNSVKIKKLKSRWGSCNANKDIVLNAYLIQLPWHLIDYVILHELMHTQRMSHDAAFWDSLSLHVNSLKEIRREIRGYQPILTTMH